MARPDANRAQQGVRHHRLRDVKLEPGIEHVAHVFGASERGQCNRRNVAAALRWECANTREQGVTVFARHADITDQDVWRLAFERREAISRRRRCRDGGAGLAQEIRDHVTRIIIVVHDEDSQALQHAELRALLRRGDISCDRVDVRRQRHGKRGTCAEPFAVCRDGAAVCFDEVAYDREAEAKATALACRRAVELAKPFEDRHQMFAWNAMTGIAYFDRDL
ncbi:MAG TPA: hypothetical protein VGL61_19860 [Kofleriaceae bacterium]